MKLFRDRYTSRNSGRFLLVLVDSIAGVAAFLFATGLAAAPERASDALFLLLWVVTPHCVSTFVDTFLQQRDLLRSYLASLSLAVFVLALFSCGFALLVDGGGGYEVPGPGLLFLILATWITGFLLFVPRVYLFHDLFLFGLVLLGVAAGRPHATLWLPLFLVAAMMSAALRHQLHDVLADVRRAKLNVQNARACTLLVAGAVIVPLVVAYEGFGVYGVPDAPHADAPVTVVGNESRVKIAPRTPQPPPLSTPFAGASDSEGRRIGLASRVQLGSLEQPRYDTRAVLVARATDPESGEIVSLTGGVLWKALVFSTFDPKSESWVADTVSRSEAVDPSLPVRLPAPPVRAASVSLSVHLFAASFPAVITPYFPNRVRFTAWQGNVVSRSTVTHNTDVNLLLLSGSTQDLAYEVDLRPDPGWWAAVPSWGTELAHWDQRYLQVPSTDALGWDVKALAERVFVGCKGVADRLLALEDFLTDEGFHYSDRAFWKRDRGAQLRGFIEDEKVGNCEYFATFVTILLRASGVSTRAVGGYAGCEWDSSERLYVVRNAQAHLWTEVYVPGVGWYPFDATAVVPGATSYPIQQQPSAQSSPSNADEGAPGVAAEDATGSSTAMEASATSEAAATESLVPPPRPGVSGSQLGRDDSAPTAAPDGELAPLGASRYRLAAVGESGWDSQIGDEARTGAAAPSPEASVSTAARRNAGERTPATARPASRLSELWRGGTLRWLMTLCVVVAGVLMLLSFLRGRRDGQLEEERELEEAGEFGDELVPAVWARRDREPTTNAERVLFAYQELQEQLTELRRQRFAHETPVEYAKRLRAAGAQKFAGVSGAAPNGEGRAKEGPAGDGRAGEGEGSLDELHGLVYDALYGARRCEDADVTRARALCRQLRSTL
ncbi:MAG: transglutaminase domain-containing protein [Planctomycetota bacterium]